MDLDLSKILDGESIISDEPVFSLIFFFNTGCSTGCLLFFSQSQLDKMEKSQVDSLSPEDFQELSQSILLDAKEPENPVMLSEGNKSVTNCVCVGGGGGGGLVHCIQLSFFRLA